MSKFLISSIMTASLALAACTTIVENIPGVYTIDVQQGNIITQEVVDQLRPNMNKRQVLYIMGTPMLRDVFHKNRWEYIFSEQPGGEQRLQKRISLYFKEDALTGVQGDFRPSNVTGLKPSHEVSIELPKREVERTMSEKVVNLFTFDDPEAAVKPEAIENEAAAASNNLDTSEEVDAIASPPDSESSPEVETSEESPTQQPASSENTNKDASETADSIDSAADSETKPAVETGEDTSTQPAASENDKTDASETADSVTSPPDSESSPEAETSEDAPTQQPASSEIDKINTTEEIDSVDSASEPEPNSEAESIEESPTQPASSEIDKIDASKEANPDNSTSVSKSSPEVETSEDTVTQPSETDKPNTSEEGDFFDSDYQIELPESLQTPPTLSEPGVINTIDKTMPRVLNPETPAIQPIPSETDVIDTIKDIKTIDSESKIEFLEKPPTESELN